MLAALSGTGDWEQGEMFWRAVNILKVSRRAETRVLSAIGTQI